MFNVNSGYVGYKMSVRALNAYESGEKPLSKWTKDDIINGVLKYHVYNVNDLKKFNRDTLVRYFLEFSSWHHTSSYFKETDFYSISEERATNRDIDQLLETSKEIEEEKQAKKAVTPTKCKVHYLVWGGTRKHPRAEEMVDYAIIIGNWAYLLDGSKKSINANGFKVLETYKRSPRNTAKIYNGILNGLPKTIKAKLQ